MYVYMLSVSKITEKFAEEFCYTADRQVVLKSALSACSARSAGRQ